MNRASAWPASVILLALLATTCRQVLEIEDLSEAHAPNQPAPHPCEPTTHTCVAAAPASWIGPVVLFMGPEGTAPACPGELGKTVGTYHDELTPGEASCNCTCADAEGIACDAPASVCYRFDSLQCAAVCLDFDIDATFPPNVCTTVIGTPAFASVSIPPPTDMGSCAPVANHVLPDPAWGTTARACEGPTTPEGCAEGEVCTPNPHAPFDKTCVWHGENVACPDDLYKEKHVLYTGFEDSSCSPCACGPPKSTCGGAVNFTTNGCQFLLTSIEHDQCLEIEGATGASYIPSPTGTCQPSGGRPSGTVEKTGPVTFCCLHP